MCRPTSATPSILAHHHRTLLPQVPPWCPPVRDELAAESSETCTMSQAQTPERLFFILVHRPEFSVSLMADKRPHLASCLCCVSAGARPFTLRGPSELNNHHHTQHSGSHICRLQEAHVLCRQRTTEWLEDRDATDCAEIGIYRIVCHPGSARGMYGLARLQYTSLARN